MTTKEIIAKAEKYNATKLRIAAMFATEHASARIRRNAMNLIIHGKVVHRANPLYTIDEDMAISDALCAMSDYREYTDRDTFTYTLDAALKVDNRALYA